MSPTIILSIICTVLAVLSAILVLNLFLIKKSLKEIKAETEEKLTESTNTPIGVSSADKDVKALAASLNIQLKRLNEKRHLYEQGDSELKRAVTNISHDLRTPLTAICGYLDLLQREQMTENAGEYIKIIKNRTEAMKKLTEELFMYSVIMAKETAVETAPLTVNEVLEESVAAFYAVLNEKGIKPNINITDKKIVRSADRPSLSRIFANLLGNAVKYSDGDLDITLNENGEIIFSNTSSELDEVQVGRLFERFYTVEAGRSSTGLGLSIAKALAEEMNGNIWADYKNGRIEVHLILKE